MNEPYYYAACGLDNVWLTNGFNVVETPYGKGVSIDDADQLHEVIATHIVCSPAGLRGQEVRFLRSQLNVSQAGLGDILGTSRATIARWESAPETAITGTADRALRLFYALKLAGDEIAHGMLDILAKIDELEHTRAEFEDTDLGWVAKAKAA